MAAVSDHKNELAGLDEAGGSSVDAVKVADQTSVEAGLTADDDAGMERIEKVYR
jgi:hypothetical protein